MYYIDKMKEQLALAKKHRACMKKGLDAYNKVCQDYEHLIEYYKYDAVQGAKILAGLRDARIKRRFYKDNISVMDSVISNIGTWINRVTACQKRAATHPNWKKDYNEDIKAIISMKDKK